MNPKIESLQAYPFEKLQSLHSECKPPENLKHIALSIGEPKHKAPAFVLKCLQENLEQLSAYPKTKGLDALRNTIAQWLAKRYRLSSNSINADHHILPVSGTREALFSFTQAVISDQSNSLVFMPNPFYQIYEGACLLAGAKPHFLNSDISNGFIPDFETIPATQWKNCQLLFICSPGNPSGAVIPIATLQKLQKLAVEHNFIIASDECYSELYHDEATPPPGLLEACIANGDSSFKQCVVFHSLSKRSNLPGLRSGFVAGNAKIIAQYLRYRTYHGCTMPVPIQQASIDAWRDETHVQENRRFYREKFLAVHDILKGHLDINIPAASFYLWPRTPIDDELFSQQLFDQQNVTVLPGKYLARSDNNGVNPGSHHVRMALVAPLDECVEAAHRIKTFINGL